MTIQATAIYVLWRREMIRFFRAKSRIFGSLAMPDLLPGLPRAGLPAHAGARHGRGDRLHRLPRSRYHRHDHALLLVHAGHVAAVGQGVRVPQGDHGRPGRPGVARARPRRRGRDHVHDPGPAHPRGVAPHGLPPARPRGRGLRPGLHAAHRLHLHRSGPRLRLADEGHAGLRHRHELRHLPVLLPLGRPHPARELPLVRPRPVLRRSADLRGRRPAGGPDRAVVPAGGRRPGRHDRVLAGHALPGDLVLREERRHLDHRKERAHEGTASASRRQLGRRGFPGVRFRDLPGPCRRPGSRLF
ncbi:MAG: hypothetical protein MZU91_11265 [Desulfosudis oleivorans]|nr:hypothetical protein [Desulfosudis oleivorans]